MELRITIMIATEQNTECKNDNFSNVLDHLDDFGLTPNQFRVYCRLLRLAEGDIVCESSENIAKACKLTRVTVLRVLQELVQMAMIECDRAPGKKSVFYLMPVDMWCQSIPHKERSKVIRLRTTDTCKPNIQVEDTCKADIQVNEINTPQQESTEPPYRGFLDSAAAGQPVNEMNQSNSDTGSLDEKLEAARERGWRDTGTWWNDLGQQVVTVNRFVVSVAEFMQRSLDSFDVGQQMCVEGLRKCKEQIEKIKQRKSQQRERVVTIALVQDNLNHGCCNG